MTASLRQLPGGRSIAAKFVNEGFSAPLANSIDDMQRSVSGGLSAEQSARQATQAVREFVGTKADAGTVEATRKASQAATFSQYGDAPVSRDDLANVVRAIREQRNLDRPLHTNEPNSAKFNSVVDQFIGSLQRARKGDVTYTVQDVWNISEQFGEIANFRGIASANNLNLITGRDVRDADVVYSALRAAIKNASPEADRGIHALELLRRVNESLSPLVKPVREGDPNLVLRFATAPNFNQRWDSFQQLAPVESQAAFSGAYLGQFIQKVATNREVLDPSSKNVLAKTMTREFQSPQSPFYAARFDRVLSPELRQHFLDVAGVSDRISRGIGAAAGSATAPRTADALLVAAGSKLPEMNKDSLYAAGGKAADSSRCSVASADYLLMFRRKGENKIPIRHPNGLLKYAGERVMPADLQAYRGWKGNQIENRYSHWIWRQYASAFWDDIRIDRVLPFKAARDTEDEKHVHPLQLDVIDRCLVLWSNPGEIVLTPFMGVGSEIYGAVRAGRKGNGIELKDSYFRQAVRNVEEAAKGAPLEQQEMAV